MLKQQVFRTIIRFLFCWIIPAIAVGTILYIVEYLIFEYRLRNDWNRFRYSSWIYELKSTLYLFFFVSICYLIYTGLAKIFMRQIGRNIRSLIWSVLFSTGMLFLPFILTMSLTQLIIYWVIMVIIGLLFPLIDELIYSFKTPKIK